MASQRRYCVPNCNVTRADKIPMQSFPNPDIHPDRFRTWLPLSEERYWYRFWRDSLNLKLNLTSVSPFLSV
ncbi:hypothetical protein evm_010208 [Chilo suppressalis]|nr:hypothetical protein evm_010208 [Chilo suppressalis]